MRGVEKISNTVERFYSGGGHLGKKRNLKNAEELIEEFEKEK